MRLFPAAIAVLLLALETPCAARTYVDEPTVGHAKVGVGLLLGTTIGTEGMTGGGVESFLGWAWTSGIGVGVVGGVSWGSPSSRLGDAIGDRSASLRLGWAGLGARWDHPDVDVAPFVHVALVAESLSVRGGTSSDPVGATVAVATGLRFRSAPWDVYVGLDARASRFGADLDLSRLSLVVGTALDLAP